MKKAQKTQKVKNASLPLEERIELGNILINKIREEYKLSTDAEIVINPSGIRAKVVFNDLLPKSDKSPV